MQPWLFARAGSAGAAVFALSVLCVALGIVGNLPGALLFLTGERFSGTQAVTMGLAHLAVPASGLAAAVQQQIDAINAAGPIAVTECKKLVRRIPTLPRDAAFAEATTWSTRMFLSAEASEGMAAFREKRKPNWVQD